MVTQRRLKKLVNLARPLLASPFLKSIEVCFVRFHVKYKAKSIRVIPQKLDETKKSTDYRTKRTIGQ